MKRQLAKLIAVILTAVLFFSVGVTALAAPSSVQGAPNESTVKINNAPVSFEAYTISGNNYFKLRDLAMALMGSAKRFSVEWDGNANAVRITSEGRYNPVGGELKVSGNTSSVTAAPTTATIYLDGKQIYVKAYVIAGANYLKLRDLGAAMNFSTTYDGATKSINVDTIKEYYMPAMLEILPGATYKEYYTPEQLAAMPLGTVGEGKIFYNRTDSGSITITEYSRTYFNIASVGLSSENDLAKLKNVIGIFVSTPEQVMDAVNLSKTAGQKTLLIEGKSFTCNYYAQTISIIINW